jgi:molybdopterin synthase catalytic subunit
MRRLVRIAADDFDPGAELAALHDGDTGVGGVASFTGFCRDEGGRLAALELEHYPALAEAEVGRVLDEAEIRWPLAALHVIHRVGLIRPGERIVFVGAAAAHRADAFAAATFVIDMLKTRAPFWKKEHAATGEGDWVEARDSDAERAKGWVADKG